MKIDKRPYIQLVKEIGVFITLNIPLVYLSLMLGKKLECEGKDDYWCAIILFLLIVISVFVALKTIIPAYQKLRDAR